MSSINGSVSYNPQAAFAAAANKPAETAKNPPIAAVKMEEVKDKAELSTQKTDKKAEKKEHKGGGFHPVQGFKNFVAGCKKLGVGVVEYGKATAIGGLKGTVAAVATFLGFGLLNKVKDGEAAKQLMEKTDLKNGFEKFGKWVLNHTPENNDKGNIAKIAIAFIVGAIPLGIQLYDASLNVSEKNSAIDHRYNTGHKKEK